MVVRSHVGEGVGECRRVAPDRRAGRWRSSPTRASAGSSPPSEGGDGIGQVGHQQGVQPEVGVEVAGGRGPGPSCAGARSDAAPGRPPRRRRRSRRRGLFLCPTVVDGQAGRRRGRPGRPRDGGRLLDVEGEVARSAPGPARSTGPSLSATRSVTQARGRPPRPSDDSRLSAGLPKPARSSAEARPRSRPGRCGASSGRRHENEFTEMIVVANPWSPRSINSRCEWPCWWNASRLLQRTTIVPEDARLTRPGARAGRGRLRRLLPQPGRGQQARRPRTRSRSSPPSPATSGARRCNVDDPTLAPTRPWETIGSRRRHLGSTRARCTSKR